MNPADLIVAAMPYSMGVAVAGSIAIGWTAKKISIRVYREKVRHLTRRVREISEDRATALADLAEERDLVNALMVDLAETRKALRAATADPSQASPRHMTITRIREIADRPLPGESTGAHAATTDT